MHTNKLTTIKFDMYVIRSHEYRLKPWKNGLGKTREIINKSFGSNLAWRLSLAFVDGDGPFSNFKGLERILTVIRGDGMRLVGAYTEYNAHPFTPVRFSGSENIVGHCNSVPIENFNLIFDPVLVKADIKIVNADTISRITGKSKEVTILHVLKGHVSCENDLTLAMQDTGLCKGIIPVLQTSKDLLCAVVSIVYC